MHNVIVIGGGASGMIAAITAASHGSTVLLIEKNQRLGEKLRISGGGRCNILNAEDDTRLLLSNYGSAGKFLHSAFNIFGMRKTYDYFESIGLPLKIEANKRAFPASGKAEEVVSALRSQLNQRGVKVLTNTSVQSINTQNGQITSVQAGDKSYKAQSYILSTGGLSRPETGSTGDGLKWLTDLGHTTRQPTPNITPLRASDQWIESVSGRKAENVIIRFSVDNKVRLKVSGDVLFTHFGVSGPSILNNAYRVAELLESGPVGASIDLYPDLDTNILDAQVINTLDQHRAKSLKNTLKYLVPGGVAPAIALLWAETTDLDTNCSELSKNNRSHLVKLLKGLPLNIEGLMGFDRAVVADGGVALNEIDMRTMRSLKVSNLFVTGDLLDVRRPSGGYSLQLCWTTGHIAGTQAAKLT